MQFTLPTTAYTLVKQFNSFCSPVYRHALLPCICICQSVSIYVCLYLYQYVCICICQSVSLSVCLYLYQFVCIYISLSVSVSVCLYLPQSSLWLLSAVPLGRLEHCCGAVAAGLPKYQGRPRLSKCHKIYTDVFSHTKNLTRRGFVSPFKISPAYFFSLQIYAFLLPYC